MYGTAQMQVDGLGQMPVLVLKYSRTNAGVEYASVQQEHNMMVHVTSWALSYILLQKLNSYGEP